MELRANATAAFAMAGRRAEGAQIMEGLPDVERHEVAYNEATAMLLEGDWDGAEARLKAAERMCRRDTFPLGVKTPHSKAEIRAKEGGGFTWIWEKF